MNGNMQKAVGVVISVLIVAAVAQAQDTSQAWNTSLSLDVTATQTAYSDSWTGGEAGSFNWVANLNGLAEKQMSAKFNLRSTLKASFGQSMSQDKDTKDWSKPSKSTDLIDWENLGRFTLGGLIDPYTAFRLETQFLDASVDAKKRYLNPMRLTESAGAARLLYKKDASNILSRLGFALRHTISRDIIDTAYNTRTNTATDGGLESVSDVKWTFSGRLTYTGKLTIYKAFFFSKKDDFAGTPFEDDWTAVDVNWENIVSASITKIVTVNFYAQFLYDKQVSRKGRLKETLGIGFALKLA
ncbi:MAG TPA: DUF3078 domain-containing protein [Candidatus Deferrimicrobium sp.]|nr:DUF3078 domain-containing protein [Candidatus Deferrimicrobium sp.]